MTSNIRLSVTFDECRVYHIVMLSVIILNVITLNVIMLNVIMLNVIMLNVVYNYFSSLVSSMHSSIMPLDTWTIHFLN
jgi:hypothetical protein